MADRIQVRNNIRPEAIRPQARPVDTFVIPAVQEPDRMNELTQLAGALKEINPALQSFFVAQKENVDKEEEARGAREFAQNRKAFKQAVEEGYIPAGANPHFQRGWRQQELRMKGYAFDQALRQAYQSDEIRNTDDPTKFAQFVQQFTEQWTNDNLGDFDDVEVAEAFLPLMGRAQSVLQQRHVEQRVAEIEHKAKVNAGTEIGVTMENSAAQPGGYNATDVGAAVTSQLRGAIADGMHGSDANKIAVDSVVAQAMEKGDLSMLETLDHIETGSGPLSKTTYARQKRREAEITIANTKRAEESHRIRMMEHRRSEAVRTALGQAFGIIEENPGANLSGYLTTLAKVDPSAASTLNAYQQARLTATNRIIEDPQTLAELYASLDDPDANGAEIIMRYAVNRQINQDSAKDAFRYWQQNRDNADVFRSREYKDAAAALDSVISGGFNEKAEKRYAAFRAKSLLRGLAAEWVTENKKPDGSYSRPKLELYLTETVDKLLRMDQFGVDLEVENTDLSPVDTAPTPAEQFETMSRQQKPKAKTSTKAKPPQRANPFDLFDTK